MGASKASFVLLLAAGAAFQMPRRTAPTLVRRATEDGSIGGVSAEKAAQMERMGYRYDEARRTWTRAPVGAVRKKPLRSGLRSIDLTNEGDRAAADAFATRVRDARKDSFQDTETATELSKLFKMLLSQAWAAPAFGAICLAVAYEAAGAPAPAAPSGDWAAALAGGLAAGAPLAAARVASHRLSKGLEPPDGRALERSLVDASVGGHALPSPWEWRTTDTDWRLRAALLGAVVDAARVAVLHGSVQPALAIYLSDDGVAPAPLRGALALAAVAGALAGLPAAIGAVDDALAPERPRDGRIDDGVLAEREAARRFADNAEAYFLATDEPDAAAAKAVVVARLAATWDEAFGRGPARWLVGVGRATAESGAAALAAAHVGGAPAAWVANQVATLAVAAFPDAERNVVKL